jgi:hypothetical protein
MTFRYGTTENADVDEQNAKNGVQEIRFEFCLQRRSIYRIDLFSGPHPAADKVLAKNGASCTTAEIARNTLVDVGFRLF